MMLRSRTRILRCVSHRLPQALICSAGLAMAGCGGRFLESPPPLTRSHAETSADEISGRSSIADSPSESKRSWGFLGSLFRRDPKPDEWDRDPFLDTPVFAAAETPDRPVGSSLIEDRDIPEREPLAATDLNRTPHQRPAPAGVASVPADRVAIAQVSASATPSARQVAPDDELPEWARQTTREQERFQQQSSRSVAASRGPLAAEPEGRIRIGRLGTESLPASRSEQAPSPSHHLETLLGNRSESTRQTPRAERSESNQHLLSDQRDSHEPVESPRPRADRATPIGELFPDSPNQSLARADQPVSRPTRALENPFENSAFRPRPDDSTGTPTVSAPPPAERTAAVAAWPPPTTPTATSTVAATERKPAPPKTSSGSQIVDHTPWPDAASVVDGFPMFNEWRGVQANAAVALSDSHGGEPASGSDDDSDIHQTAFEQRPAGPRQAAANASSTLLSDGLAMAEQDRLLPFRAESGVAIAPATGSVTVPAAPPIDINPDVSGSENSATEGGSRIGWFIVLLIAAGLGTFALRHRILNRTS